MKKIMNYFVLLFYWPHSLKIWSYIACHYTLMRIHDMRNVWKAPISCQDLFLIANFVLNIICYIAAFAKKNINILKFLYQINFYINIYIKISRFSFYFLLKHIFISYFIILQLFAIKKFIWWNRFINIFKLLLN